MNLSQINELLISLEQLKSFLLEQKENAPIIAEILKSLLNEDAWPEAVPNNWICDKASEEDKNLRAEAVIEIMSINLKNKTFLDFGCGEGHIVKYAKEYAKLAMGYDIAQTGSLPWDDYLTTDFSKIADSKFDIILLYDVLDHAKNPVEVLTQAKSLCDHTSKIYVRCHPWCCRHGGHLYQKINKAFVHLVVNEEELTPEAPIQRVIHPVKEYQTWFDKVNLHVQESSEDLTEVESFFQNEKPVKKAILSMWNKSPNEKIKLGHEFPEYPMKQNYRDYVLKL